MKKIIFITILLFAAFLVANSKFSSAEAEPIKNIKVLFSNKPTNNPVEIKIYSSTDAGKQSKATPFYNAFGHSDAADISFDLHKKVKYIQICVDRKGYTPECAKFTRNNLLKNANENGGSPVVSLKIPCSSDCNPCDYDPLSAGCQSNGGGIEMPKLPPQWGVKIPPPSEWFQ